MKSFINRQSTQKLLNNAKEKKQFYWMLFGIFIAVFILNCFTVLIADDFRYAISKNFISTFIDEAHYYFIMNGRSLAHIIARNFFLLPKIIFNTINSLMYIYLTLLIYVYANPEYKVKINTSLYLLINVCIWLFAPHFGQTILWQTGACNYLWCTAIILSFLLPYYLYSIQKFDFNKKSYLSTIGMFFAGIAAGWCNENTSGGCILFVLILFLYCKLNKIKARSWMTGGLLGTIIGFLIMLLSPGNRLRMATTQQNSLIVELVKRFTNITITIQENMMVLICIWLVLFITLIFTNKKKEKLTFSLLFAFLSMAIIYALIFIKTGYWQSWGRSMFGGVIFMIIAVAYTFSHIEYQHKTMKIISFCFIGILSLYSIFLYYFAVYDMAIFKMNVDKRNAYVEAQKNAGNVNPIVSLMPIPESSHNPQYILRDIVDDTSDWLNESYCVWAGIDSIRSVDQSVWENIYQKGNPELMNCYDAESYFQLLNNNSYKILISANDDISKIAEKLSVQLNQLGLKQSWTDFNQLSYIAMIDDHQLIYEESAKQRLVYENKIDNQALFIKSKGSYLDDKTLSSIIINGTEYSRNKKGLNLVIYDNQQGRVVDSLTIQYDQKDDDLVLRR